jgi:hypothetical protein
MKDDFGSLAATARHELVGTAANFFFMEGAELHLL